MSTTLPLFWNLSSAVKEERIDASVKLVGTLQEFQSKYTPVASGSDDEDTDAEAEGEPKNPANDIDELNAEDVRYAIRRLGRGLASPRESSRLGFAVALTELLSRLNTVSSAQVISLVLNSTQTQGSMQGHEVRDQYFARLFGLMSAIQSGLLFRHSTLPISPSSRTLTSTLTDFQTVVTELVALGEKKSWLRESCWWALSISVDGLAASSVPWKSEATTWIGEKVFVENTSWTPDKLAFALKLQAIDPSLPWKKKYLAPTFKDGQILATTNLATVSRILRDVAPEDDEKDVGSGKKGSGSWKPQLHHAWSAIFQQYYPENGAPSSGKSTFQDFYRIAVDESLFSLTASPERKSWGFSVFEQALTSVPHEELPLLFTKNFMRTWINHLSGQDRALHKAARQIAAAIQGVADKHPAIGFTLVLQLLGTHGNRQFDKITKTKTVENLIASTNVEGVEKFIAFVRGQVDEGEADDSDPKSVDAKRVWAIDQFTSLIRNGAIPKSDSWVSSILEFFVVHGFFSVTKKNSKSPLVTLHSKPSPEFSSSSRKLCRERFLTCVAELSTQTLILQADEGKTTRLIGAASDGELWLLKALALIETIEADIKHTKPLATAEAELVSLRVKATDTRQRLETVDGSLKEAAKGGRVLLASLSIQTYDPDAQVETVLEECISSVLRLCFPPPAKSPKKKKKRKSKAPTDLDEQEEPIPVETLPIDEILDVLIGFLETGTSYSKAVATLVFSLVTAEVGESGIALILTQLEQRDVAENNEEEEEEGDAEDDEELGSAIDVDSPAEDDDDHDDGDEADSEEEYDIEVDAELRRKIAEALQVSGDADEEDEEDEVMDDEQMLKMDEQLAQVFRLQQGPKVAKKETLGLQREATHFKIRVLDLLDLYVRKRPSSEHIISIVQSLVEAIRGARADEEQFAAKATSLLQSRVTKLKEIPDKINTVTAREAFQSLHQLARRAPTAALVSTISQATIFVARILVHLHEDDIVLAEYKSSLDDFITRKASRLQIKFFQDWAKRLPLSAWAARDHIIALCMPGKAVNAFRQMQGISLLMFPLVLKTDTEETKSRITNEVIAHIPSCRSLVYSILAETADSEEESLNPAQLKSVLKYAGNAVRVTRKLAAEQSEIAKLWEPEALESIIGRFQGNARLAKVPALGQSCQQLLASMRPKPQKAGKKGGDAGSGAGAKRKVDDTAPAEENTSSTPSRKVKRKKVSSTA